MTDSAAVTASPLILCSPSESTTVNDVLYASDEDTVAPLSAPSSANTIPTDIENIKTRDSTRVNNFFEYLSIFTSLNDCNNGICLKHTFLSVCPGIIYRLLLYSFRCLYCAPCTFIVAFRCAHAHLVLLSGYQISKGNGLIRGLDGDPFLFTLLSVLDSIF